MPDNPLVAQPPSHDGALAAERIRVAGDLYHGQVPASAVYVGRAAPGLPASRYANPHRVGKACRVCGVVHGDRAAAVTAYAADLEDRPEFVDEVRAELAGVDLACWCPLDGPCHGDLLILVATGATPADALQRVLAPA